VNNAGSPKPLDFGVAKLLEPDDKASMTVVLRARLEVGDAKNHSRYRREQ
jgi:hypothetical protein